MVEHWAIQNDCNGVFSHTIRLSRSAVEAIFKAEGFDAECRIVPVVVFDASAPADKFTSDDVKSALKNGARPHGWGAD